MGMNKLVFAALCVGCLLTAGVGGFLAVRLAQPAPPVAAVSTDVPSQPGVTALPTAAPSRPELSESAAPIASTPAPAATAAAVPAVSAPVAPAPAATPQPVARVATKTPSRVEPRPDEAPVRLATRVASSSEPRIATRPSARPSRESVEPAGTLSSAGTSPVTPAPSVAPAAAPVQPLPQNAGTMWEARQAVQAETPVVVDAAPEPPPAPEFIDLTVPRDAVLGLQIERTVSSDNARTEDRVTARVTRDVRVGNRIAIPAGSLVTGSVLAVDRGGRVRGRSRLSVRFHTLTLTDGTEVTLRTDPVIREGQSASGESAAKVGGAAIGGAILGAILGGQRGAAVGAGIGAAGGTAAAMTNTPDQARLSAGTTITLRMQEQIIVSVPRD